MRSITRGGTKTIQGIKLALSNLKNFLYPRYCFQCKCTLKSFEEMLCLCCVHKLPSKRWTNHLYSDTNTRLWGRVPLNHTYSLFVFKENSLKKLIYQFKYFNNIPLGLKLSLLLAENIGSHFTTPEASQIFDGIIPMPIHFKKLNKRGFNQSLIIAETLSRELNIPLYNNSIIKTKGKRSQTALNSWERWQNRRGDFQLICKDLLKNKHLLIVDDILTSGASIEALYQCLSTVPGVSISVCCLAISES